MANSFHLITVAHVRSLASVPVDEKILKAIVTMNHGEVPPHALKARLLADLICAMEAGHVLQASTVAALLERTPAELISQSVGIRGLQEGFVDERLQSHLRNIVAVLSVAERHFGGVLQAVHWYLTGWPATDEQPTPEAMVAGDRVQDAYRRLLRQPSALSHSVSQEFGEDR